MPVEPIFTLQQFIIGWIVIMLLTRVVAEVIVRLENKKTRQNAPKHFNEQSQFKNHYNIKRRVG